MRMLFWKKLVSSELRCRYYDIILTEKNFMWFAIKCLEIHKSCSAFQRFYNHWWKLQILWNDLIFNIFGIRSLRMGLVAMIIFSGIMDLHVFSKTVLQSNNIESVKILKFIGWHMNKIYCLWCSLIQSYLISIM